MNMRNCKWTALALIAIFHLGCASKSAKQLPPPLSDAEPVMVQDLKITAGQTIYVPAYSEIYYSNDRTLNLTITLSIRNTDLTNSIVLTSVRYFDTHGQLVREYLSQPKRLGPMASSSFFVETSDRIGGIGANFIVEWVAEQSVYEPVVEAIMIDTSGNQGISFVSTGRVIERLE